MVYNEIKEMIPDFVRGLLSPADAAEVQDALSKYPELVQEYENSKRYYQLLDQLPEAKASPDFIANVNRGIDRKSPAETIIRLLFKPFAVKLPFEIIAVTACLIAVVFLIKPSFIIQKNRAVASELASVENDQTAKMEHSTPEMAKSAVPSMTNNVAQKELPVSVNSSDRKAGEQIQRAESSVKKSKDEKISAPAPEQFASNEQARQSAISAMTQAADKVPATRSEASAEGVPSEPLQLTESFSNKETAVNESAELKGELKPGQEANDSVIDIGTIEVAFIESSLMKGSQSDDEVVSAEESGGQGYQARYDSDKRDRLAYSEKKKAKVPAQTMAIQASLDSVLTKYDPSYNVNVLHGETTYVLTITPNSLAALKHELSRKFSITLHTSAFDKHQTKMIKVSIVVKDR